MPEMSWRARSREIERLRKKHGTRRARDTMPDLSVEERTAPCSATFARITYPGARPRDAAQFPVGTLHKQGMVMITPDQVKNDLAWFGGKKS